MFGVTLDALTGRRPGEALTFDPATQPVVAQARAIAAALDEAQRALQAAHAAVETAAQALRMAAARLPSSRSSG